MGDDDQMKNKRVPFILLTIICCAVFLFLGIYFLAPKEAKKPENAATIEEIYLIFDDPQLNRKLTDASAIMLKNKEFYDYLWKSVPIYDGSFTSMDELKNDQFFTPQEQNVMIEAFSLLKGITCIEHHGDYIEFILRLENRDAITLYYLPPAGDDMQSQCDYKATIQNLSQFTELNRIDDNWYMNIWEAPDKH